MAEDNISSKPKEELFHRLSNLSESEDETFVDKGRLASEEFLKHAKSAPTRRGTALRRGSSRDTRSRPVTPNKRSTSSNRSSPPVVENKVRRTVSAPIGASSLSSSSMRNEQSNARKEPPASTFGSSEPHPPPLRHTTSAPPIRSDPLTMSSSAAPRASGKRKRVEEAPMVAAVYRIFSGFNFYFFPNTDANKARKARITKAKEYGAVWVKDWAKGITHVIMDDGMNYQELIKYLKIDSIPDKSDTLVVNATYPSDCITHRFLLNPASRSYEVPGCPKQVLVNSVTAVASSPPTSLPLKPPTKGVLTRNPGTPTPSALTESHEYPPDVATVATRTTEDLQAANQSFGYNDDLSAIIKEARTLQHIPIDLEDDDISPQSAEDAEPDSDSDNSPAQRLAPLKKSKKNWQDNFQCMDKHDGTSKATNPNAETIEILQQMSDFYERIQDTWRPFAYRRAIASLKQQPIRIVDKEEALKLPFVGGRLAAKIEEIALTHGLRRLDNARLDPLDQVLQMFMKIYGVGISQASRWVNQGFRAIDDLLERVKLTDNQRIGIAHYDDFQQRIPRAEVERHGAIVKRALQSIDPEFEVTIGGSYRRGAKNSGDVDLIVTKPNAKGHSLRTVVVETLVPKLMADGFLTAALAKVHGDTGSKWHGCSKLPDSPVWRRIDLLLVPWDEMGAALIYFTGNDIFNRSVRLLASKKGMRLNQRGLFKDVISSEGRVRITEGELLEGRDERRIFEILGVPWRPPHHRIC